MWQKALENLDTMMLHRGYVFLRFPEENYLLYADSENRQILVWCFMPEKLNIDGIKEFIHTLEKGGYTHGMVIYGGLLTSSTRKILENLYKFRIELFVYRELQYDLTKFRYYCPHEKVSPEEAVRVREKFGNSLPSLLRTDAVVRYFFFQKNDVIRITRRNGTIVYRVVK
jgi:DNA-directed RNA polymerase subunit H (RpoH/RPB5)